MRPLPRLHAITDAAVLELEDLGVRAAAIAAAGPAVALHARDHGATARRLLAVTRRFLSLARPPEATVFVNGRADVAVAGQAHGLQLGRGDLSPPEVRAGVARDWPGWIGVSVHDEQEAESAARGGADFLLVGTIYSSPSHTGRVPAGPELLRRLAPLGLPQVAIGGISAERVREVRDAGAYGVAAISALWRATDPARAAVELLEPWMEEA